MFFKVVKQDNKFNRIQITLGNTRRSLTIKQFIARVAIILNELGYEVIKQNKEE